jgi:integrase/recombinase XerD
MNPKREETGKMKTLEVLEKVLEGKRLKPITQINYRKVLKSLSEYSEDWPSKAYVINNWLNRLTQFSDMTIRLYYQVGKSSARYMKKSYNLPNPFDKAESPKVHKKARRIFTADEMMRIMGACRFGYDRELVLTLIDSTCRIGELDNLKGSDVNDINGFINVTGKTDARKYRLDVRICKALKELAGSDDGYVFKNRFGKKQNPGTLQARARKIIKRAGITGKKLGPHTLRHSGATFVARKTQSALVVKALLQHDDIATSMEYIHDVEDSLQQSISPLQLVKETAIFGHENMDNVVQTEFDSSQMTGSELVVVKPEADKVDNGVPEYIKDMFPEVEAGRETRPLLKENDLNLLRNIFIEYSGNGGNHENMLKARELMKRILRRTR